MRLNGQIRNYTPTERDDLALGRMEPQQRRLHCYRMQRSRFLIEYDNVQSNINHIHSVYHGLLRDLNADLLAQHCAHPLLTR